MEKRIAQLEKIIQRQQFIEDRYEELMLSARRCWRYYGADQELFTASMKAMDFLIRRHSTEIDEMNEEDDDHDPERTDLKAHRKLDLEDVPYPGMATAFEANYGQSWTDPDWRKEAATWAAAWKAALSHNAKG